MYEKFFGLKTKPFHMTPDLDFLFLSAKHKEAISCMEFGVTEDIGIILLTGEIGTGKTTLIRHILQGVDNNIDVATIYNTNLNSEQLLASILEEFGLDSHFTNKTRSIKILQEHLKSLRSLKRKPLLIIDDAQNLPLEALEELRLLSNLQNSIRMLVQIILVGQPELEAKLGDPNASSLAQRVSISYHLLPFSREEAEEYIAYRLAKAGGKANLFNQAAIDMVYSTTRGIPRAINVLCDNAMSYAFSSNVKTIDALCIKEVLKENKSRGIRPGSLFPKKASRPVKTPSSPKTLYNGDVSHSPLPCKRDVPSSNWQTEMTRRMDALERLVANKTNELKLLLKKERQRNDKLMMAYAHLKSKYDSLHKAQFERERLRSNLTDRKAVVRSANAGRRVAQLISQKK